MLAVCTITQRIHWEMGHRGVLIVRSEMSRFLIGASGRNYGVRFSAALSQRSQYNDGRASQSEIGAYSKRLHAAVAEARWS